MIHERLNETPNVASSCPSPAAEKFLPTAGSCWEGHGTSTTLLLPMPKIPDYVWSWIRESEAEMTNASCADETIMRPTSTVSGQAATSEGLPLT